MLSFYVECVHCTPNLLMVNWLLLIWRVGCKRCVGVDCLLVIVFWLFFGALMKNKKIFELLTNSHQTTKIAWVFQKRLFKTYDRCESASFPNMRLILRLTNRYINSYELLSYNLRIYFRNELNRKNMPTSVTSLLLPCFPQFLLLGLLIFRRFLIPKRFDHKFRTASCRTQ